MPKIIRLPIVHTVCYLQLGITLENLIFTLFELFFLRNKTLNVLLILDIQCSF